MQQNRSPRASFISIITRPWVMLGGAVLIAVVAIAIASQMSKATPAGQYTRATTASITAVGGVSSDLSFQVPGQVARIGATLGQSVEAGTVLVALDQSALAASRAGAAANLEAAQARLAGLQAGTRPEQIAINQTAVTQAEAALRDTIRSAYIAADDAVHNKADQFFTNPRSTSPAFTFNVPDQTLQNKALAERVTLETLLQSWNTTLNAQTFAATDPVADGQTAVTALTQVSVFLTDLATVLAESSSAVATSASTLQTYQASITLARQSVSGAMTSITTGTTAVQSARGALTLAQSGATAHDIAAAHASVDAVQAVLAGIDVALRQSTITAPVAGTVTVLNARLGQTVSPGQVIASVESRGGTKANALVVPTSSVLTTGGQAFVYVKSASGTPVKTPVTTGLVSTSGMTEIVSGLSLGDAVLTFGITN